MYNILRQFLLQQINETLPFNGKYDFNLQLRVVSEILCALIHCNGLELLLLQSLNGLLLFPF
jgi:hypothetical protein